MDYTSKCQVADAAAVKKTLVPPTLPANLKSSGFSEPPQNPPQVPEDVCNAYLPNSSTYDRYIWVVRWALVSAPVVGYSNN